MSVVRLGLLSTAGINGAILGARADDAPFDIVAVGSRDGARAQAYAHENGIARAHALVRRALLEDPSSMPSTSRCRTRSTTSGRCARSRPASTSSARSRTRAIPSEVDEAHDEAERHGLVLTEGYMWRHARQTALLRELLPQVGELRSAYTRRSPARSRVPTTCAGRATSAAARCSTSAATASAPRGSSPAASRIACTARRSRRRGRRVVRRDAAFRRRHRDVPVQPARAAREHDRGDRRRRRAARAERVRGPARRRRAERRGASRRRGQPLPRRARRLLRRRSAASTRR